MSQERISNSLGKQVSDLQAQRAALAVELEREEEWLTNTMQRKMNELQRTRADSAVHSERETEFLYNRLRRQLAMLSGERDALERRLASLAGRPASVSSDATPTTPIPRTSAASIEETVSACLAGIQEGTSGDATFSEVWPDIQLEILAAVRRAVAGAVRTADEAALPELSRELGELKTRVRSLAADNLALQRALEDEREHVASLTSVVASSVLGSEADSERAFNMSARSDGVRSRAASVASLQAMLGSPDRALGASAHESLEAWSPGHTSHTELEEHIRRTMS